MRARANFDEPKGQQLRGAKAKNELAKLKSRGDQAGSS